LSFADWISIIAVAQFYPLAGQSFLVLGNEHYGGQHILIRWRNGVSHLFPAWMTTTKAGAMEILVAPLLPNKAAASTYENLIRRARIRIGIRIVAAHGRVIAVRVLRAIPSRVVARVTVTETITEVITKKSAAETKYGAAPESTELPIEAPIEVPTCEGTLIAEVSACERMPSGEVASTTPVPAAFVSACGHGGLCNPDGERGGSGKIP
jgi:hypothetical protein